MQVLKHLTKWPALKFVLNNKSCTSTRRPYLLLYVSVCLCFIAIPKIQVCHLFRSSSTSTKVVILIGSLYCHCHCHCHIVLCQNNCCITDTVLRAWQVIMLPFQYIISLAVTCSIWVDDHSFYFTWLFTLIGTVTGEGNKEFLRFI